MSSPHPIPVTLSWSEIEIAALDAVRIEVADRRSVKLKQGAGWTGTFAESVAQGISGLCGEMAVRNYLGLPWDPQFGNFRHRPDVGMFEVKTTKLPTGRLWCHRKDNPRRKFVLVIDKSPVFTIIGWAWGQEVMVLGEWRTPRPGGSAFYLPQQNLYTMERKVKAA